MDRATLRAAQAPLKQRYRDEPQAARVTARAAARLDPGGGARIATWAGEVHAGLHPATGGDGSAACSADMLLEALVACAAVTLQSVALAMEVGLRGAVVRAEGEWDARGTLAVARDVPVGVTASGCSSISTPTPTSPRARGSWSLPSATACSTKRFCIRRK